MNRQCRICTAPVPPGRRTLCGRECSEVARRQRKVIQRAKNPEKARARAKARSQTPAAKARQRRYYERHREAILAKAKAEYPTQDKKREYNREYQRKYWRKNYELNR